MARDIKTVYCERCNGTGKIYGEKEDLKDSLRENKYGRDWKDLMQLYRDWKEMGEVLCPDCSGVGHWEF